jgi:hypothetical protein
MSMKLAPARIRSSKGFQADLGKAESTGLEAVIPPRKEISTPLLRPEFCTAKQFGRQS